MRALYNQRRFALRVFILYPSGITDARKVEISEVINGDASSILNSTVERPDAEKQLNIFSVIDQ